MFVRVKKTQNYSVISNVPIQDTLMSMKAKGLLTYMLSRPDDWDFSIEGLATAFSDGRRAISTALKELEDHGYLKRELQKRNAGGTFSKAEYTVYEEPYFTLEEADDGSKKRYYKKEQKSISENTIISMVSEFMAAKEDMNNEDAVQLAVGVLKRFGIDVIPSRALENQMEMDLSQMLPKEEKEGKRDIITDDTEDAAPDKERLETGERDLDDLNKNEAQEGYIVDSDEVLFESNESLKESKKTSLSGEYSLDESVISIDLPCAQTEHKNVQKPSAQNSTTVKKDISPCAQNATTDNATTENSTQLNTNKLNTESQNTDIKKINKKKTGGETKQLSLHEKDVKTKPDVSCQEQDIPDDKAVKPKRKKTAQKEKPPKQKYGDLDNVLLTDDEFNKLINRFPDDYQDRIDNLSYYIASKGDKYKSHYATLLNWERLEKKRASAKPAEGNRLDWLDAM